MNTVVIFGAGATKACGGPLTNEILPQAFEPTVRQAIEREYYIDLLDNFLIQNFHVPQKQENRTESDYPALPLLLSLIDTAINRNQPMGASWPVDILRQVRRALQYMVFALLEYKLRSLSHNYYIDLLRKFNHNDTPTIISLNYDIIADNSLAALTDCFPNYGCDIDTPQYKFGLQRGTLLKIHGSLNWSYCPGCNRLDLGVSQSGKTYKMLEELYQVDPLEARYSCQGFPCPVCSTHVEPILITPTQLKDYRNPHVLKVWNLAEQELRKAERVIIVGYSLPDDDLDVIYLLKRGLGNLAIQNPKNITIVEKSTENEMNDIGKHPVGRRYRTIFGPDIDWRVDGFEGIISDL